MPTARALRSETDTHLLLGGEDGVVRMYRGREVCGSSCSPTPQEVGTIRASLWWESLQYPVIPCTNALEARACLLMLSDF